MYGNQPMNTNFDAYFTEEGVEEAQHTRARACFHKLRDLMEEENIEIQSVQYVPYINDVAASRFHGCYQRKAMEYYNDLLSTEIGNYVHQNSSDPDFVFPVLNAEDYIDKDEEEYFDDEDQNGLDEGAFEDAELFGTLGPWEGFIVERKDNSTMLFCLQTLRIPQEFPDCLAMYDAMKQAGFSINHALLGSWMYKLKDHSGSLAAGRILDAVSISGGGHSPMASHFNTTDLLNFINSGVLPEPDKPNGFRSPFHREKSRDMWDRTNGVDRFLSITKDDVVGYIGVYGTLKRGHPNHRLLENAIKVRDGFYELPMEMVSLGPFPALVPSQRVNDIYMEIYGVNKDEYKDVERLEGYPNMYDRFSFLVDDFEVEAYYMEDTMEHNERVRGGNWK